MCYALLQFVYAVVLHRTLLPEQGCSYAYDLRQLLLAMTVCLLIICSTMSNAKS